MAEQSPLETDRSGRDKRIGLLIWYRISRIYNQSLKETGRHLKQWSISPAQFDALAQIGAHGRLSQQQLADKLFVTKGNITQLLSKLEESGFVKREQQWKTKYISLTEAGNELFDGVVPEQEWFQSSQFDALDREEKKQLLALLKKIQH